MRLFVAIDLDDYARHAIGAEQMRLMQAFRAGRSLRWVSPADMHLTLAFLGEIDGLRTAAVIEAMRPSVVAPPFMVAFTRLGVFPARGAPSVLWLGVGAGNHEVIAVQREIADRLERVGLPRDRRPYHPHVTLARWRTAKPSDRRRVVDLDRGAEVARVSVASLTLYRSQLSSAGPTYTRLASAPLQS